MGNGTRSSARQPAPVSGGLSLERVSAGDFHSCAETTAKRAYCWPTGTVEDDNISLIPTAVPGGLLFAQVTAGRNSCGKTPEGRGYCWGTNYDGALGTGDTASSSTPVPVAGPMP